jgi:hypothetical protein
MKRMHLTRGIVCFLFALWLTSCDSGHSTNQDNSGTQPATSATPSSTVVLISAFANAEGRFTLNRPWTQADLNTEHITATINYDSFLSDRVHAYTTLMTQYQVKRRKCEQDYNNFYDPSTFTTPIIGSTYHFQDRKCYPTNQWVYGLQESTTDPFATHVLYRYGYYCGAGYPPIAPYATNAPEPIDGVDYCCRLHDAQTWAGRGDYSNECGIAMCLRQASQFPTGLWAQLPDVEQARQYWYGNGAFGGAAYLCPGNQSNDAPPPIVSSN